MGKYIHREIESVVLSAARQFPCVIVTGPRQSGKTTLLKHLFAGKYRYVTMDDPDKRLMATNEPQIFFENNPPPLILDEIQYVPGILPYLKMIIDNDRSRMGQFILTGSQNFSLMAGVTESLAGRISVLNLLSFSLTEKVKKLSGLSYRKLQEHVIKGGFPEIYVNKKADIRMWYNSYLNTYLERDVRNIRQVGDLLEFQRFMALLAANNGNLINLSTFSRDLGVAVNTIKQWESVLETSQQVFHLKPYFNNEGKRIIQNPKIYFLDTGLVCHINHLTLAEQVFSGPGGGQLFETLFLTEIIRHYYNKGEPPGIYFWRTSYGEEVDFIIEEKGKLIPVELKLTSRIKPELAKNLKSFQRIFNKKIRKSVLVYLGRERIKLNDNIEFIPFQEFFSKFPEI
ncbi:MAG: ATP-binding protein [Bacteroidetes bacterium]|nr:ATP-binding protein [Bacteroidota bacterium]